MLEALQEKLGGALRHLRGQSKLTEENMDAALKEVRTALLSADVHFRVARQFIERVKEACLGQAVLQNVEPGQQVVKIIHDELVQLLGEGTRELPEKRPLTILLVGLQGGGKTTSADKLARLLAKRGDKPLLAACDIYRPAAIDQLETLSQRAGHLFYAERDQQDVSKIGKNALKKAREEGATVTILDTAGRLQIDEKLIEEVKRLKTTVEPDVVLLVADSALGQEAVNVAKSFHEAVGLTGIVLTKLDGDARGGAALSMKAITGVPIQFMATGEKPEDFEVFHPDRLAGRILGMGDVVSLVEKAQEKIDEKEAARLAEKMQRNEFDFEDMLAQMRQVQKLGPLGKVMGMLPGMGDVQVGDREENKIKRTEAIILSMTVRERRNPNLLRGSRVKRIADGSGTQVRDVNALLKQFSQMRKMMRQMKGGRGRKLMQQMKGLQGADGGMPSEAELQKMAKAGKLPKF